MLRAQQLVPALRPEFVEKHARLVEDSDEEVRSSRLQARVAID